MKISKTLTICFLLLYNNVQAQKIISQQTFNLPVLGNNGSQNALYWDINKSDGLIYFYATGHQNGELWSIGKNNYQDFVNKHKEKSGAGKLFDNFLAGNAFQSHIFLNTCNLNWIKILKSKMQRISLQKIRSNADSVLHFSKFGNIASLDGRDAGGKTKGENEVKLSIDNLTRP